MQPEIFLLDCIYVMCQLRFSCLFCPFLAIKASYQLRSREINASANEQTDVI